MPIYEYKCTSCESIEDVFSSMAEMKRVISCSMCGSTANKILSVPQLIGDIEPYIAPETGQPITSRQHARQVAKENGWVIVDPNEKLTPKKETVRERKQRVEGFVTESIEKCKNPEYAKEVARGAEKTRERFQEIKQDTAEVGRN